MTTIRVAANCSLPPERVLHAGYDFTARRSQVWPAVRQEHFVVHGQGETTADVTEGTPAGIGINWERCRYDWSEPGLVIATVIDSNTYAMPGSSWQLTATATETGAGSHVEMTWIRTFRRNPRGLILGTVFRIVGRPIFSRYARQVLANLESDARHTPDGTEFAPRGGAPGG